MRTDCQKDNCFIGQIFTEAVFTLRDASTLLTDHKYDTEIPVNPRTAASGQIQFSACIGKYFRIKDSCYAPVIPAKAGIHVFRRFLLSQE